MASRFRGFPRFDKRFDPPRSHPSSNTPSPRSPLPLPSLALLACSFPYPFPTVDNLLCKRPTFSDEYLPTFNRPNVTLVDTNGKGVDRITEKGIVYGGKEYAVDCIIWFVWVGRTFGRIPG